MNNDPSALDTALSTFGDIWSASVNMITNNKYLMIFLAAGLIATAFKVFKRAKKAVR